MKLAYALKEGLIDIRRFPTEWDPVKGKKTRIQVRLNGTPGVHVASSNVGQVLMSDYTGEMLILDMDTCERFGVEEETVINLDIRHALQALED